MYWPKNIVVLLSFRAHGLDDLTALVKNCVSEGAKKLVMDLCPQSLGDFIITSTSVRRDCNQPGSPGSGISGVY